MLSVQRGIYPLREIYGELSIRFNRNFFGWRTTIEVASGALPTGIKNCKAAADFGCFDGSDAGPIYSIPDDSRLFPKPQSPVAMVLNGIGLGVSFVTLREGAGNTKYHRIGEFSSTLVIHLNQTLW